MIPWNCYFGDIWDFCDLGSEEKEHTWLKNPWRKDKMKIQLRIKNEYGKKGKWWVIFLLYRVTTKVKLQKTSDIAQARLHNSIYWLSAIFCYPILNVADTLSCGHCYDCDKEFHFSKSLYFNFRKLSARQKILYDSKGVVKLILVHLFLGVVNKMYFRYIFDFLPITLHVIYSNG